jgi:hypothetical protein
MTGIRPDFISSGGNGPFGTLLIFQFEKASGFGEAEEISIHFELVLATIVRDGDGVSDGVAAFTK